MDEEKPSTQIRKWAASNMGRFEKIVLKKSLKCSKNSLDFTVVIWWKWEDEENIDKYFPTK